VLAQFYKFLATLSIDKREESYIFFIKGDER